MPSGTTVFHRTAHISTLAVPAELKKGQRQACSSRSGWSVLASAPVANLMGRLRMMGEYAYCHFVPPTPPAARGRFSFRKSFAKGIISFGG